MAEEVEIIYVVKDEATGELKQINKQMDRLDDTARKAQRGGGIFTMALGVAGGMAALNLATAGLQRLGAEFSDMLELGREQMQVEQQLAAVLESTGHAAGITADEVKALASELQGVTNFGDEATIAAQNLLLTFTNIGENIFPEVTETVLDMSTAFDQDLKSSAIQLGKALNDPINGLTALSRIGVSFTEEQKELVKQMMEVGDVAGAQGIILEELGKQVGGSARAAYEPSIALSNAWGDFKEELSKAVLPILDELAVQALPVVQEATEKVVSWVDQFIESVGGPAGIEVMVKDFIDYVVQNAIPALLQMADSINSIYDGIRNAISGFQQWKEAMRNTSGPIGSLLNQPDWRGTQLGVVNPANTGSTFNNQITQQFYGQADPQTQYDATVGALLGSARSKGAQ